MEKIDPPITIKCQMVAILYVNFCFVTVNSEHWELTWDYEETFMSLQSLFSVLAF